MSPRRTTAAARVVYVGHISPDRGAAEMVALAELLHPHGITVELVGSADAQARAVMEPARARPGCCAGTGSCRMTRPC